MGIKHEPLICELQISEDKRQQAVELIKVWESSVEAAKEARQEFFDSVRTDAKESMSKLHELMQQRAQLNEVDDAVEMAELEKQIDDLEMPNILDAVDEWIEERPLTESADAVELSLSSDTPPTLTIKPRPDIGDDWDATLAAVQYVVNGLQIKQPTQITWSHHDLAHGGDCQHFAIIQANCTPVVEIAAVNAAGRLPKMTDAGARTGWCLIKIPAGKELVAAEIVMGRRKIIRDTKAKMARVIAEPEPGVSDEALTRMHAEVGGADVIAYTADGRVAYVTPDTPVTAVMIGKTNRFEPAIVAVSIRLFVELLDLSEDVTCHWIEEAVGEDDVFYNSGALCVRKGEDTVYVNMQTAMAAVMGERPKVTVYHGQVEPTVEVEHPDLVDVEIVDTAERDLLVVSHKGYSLYWAIKDSSTNGEYFASDYWVVPYAWGDHEDEAAFDVRDLPTPSDMDMRDYAANYPDADQYQLRLIYAIDTDQLPIDISEYRDGDYEA